jgi:hypothetical protein
LGSVGDEAFESLAGDDPKVTGNALAATLGHKTWKTTMHDTHAAKEAKVRGVQAVEIRPESVVGHITGTQAVKASHPACLNCLKRLVAGRGFAPLTLV